MSALSRITLLYKKNRAIQIDYLLPAVQTYTHLHACVYMCIVGFRFFNAAQLSTSCIKLGRERASWGLQLYHNRDLGRESAHSDTVEERPTVRHIQTVKWNTWGPWPPRWSKPCHVCTKLKNISKQYHLGNVKLSHGASQRRAEMGRIEF